MDFFKINGINLELSSLEFKSKGGNDTTPENKGGNDTAPENNGGNDTTPKKEDQSPKENKESVIIVNHFKDLKKIEEYRKEVDSNRHKNILNSYDYNPSKEESK